MNIFYVLICCLEQIKTKINPFTSFHKLLTSDDIRNETVKSIGLAVKENPSFLIDENMDAGDILIIFARIHKNFLEVKVRDFFNSITKKIINFENLFWESKDFRSKLCNQIIDLIISKNQ